MMSIDRSWQTKLSGIPLGLGVTAVIALLFGYVLLISSQISPLLTSLVILGMCALAAGTVLAWNIPNISLVVLGMGLAIGTRIDIAGMSWDFVELILLGVLFTLMVMLTDRLFTPLRTYEIAFLFFILFRLLLANFAIDTRHAFSDLKEWVECFAALFVLSRVLIDDSAIKVTRWALVGGIVVSAAYSLGQAYWGWPAPFVSEQGQMKTFIDFETQSVYKVQPVVALQNHPNTFAIYIAIGTLFLLYWRTKIEGRRLRLAVIVGAGICLWAIAATFAKTTFVTLGLTLITIPLVRYWRSSVWRVLCLLGVGFGIIFLALRLLEVEGYKFALSSFFIRQRLWADSIEILTASWSSWFVGDHMIRLGEMSVWGQPHNTYLFLLLEYGLIGCALLVIGAWGLGKRVLGLESGDPCAVQDSPSLELSGALLLYLGWTAMFESVGFPVHDRILIAVVGALIVASREVSKLNREQVPKKAMSS